MPVFEEVEDMVYTHASLCECMRLYPPVPVDSKVAMGDDVLPDGTAGRHWGWGSDWAHFKPERWRKMRQGSGASLGERSLYLSSGPGRTQDLFEERDGVLADEKGGGRCSKEVQTGAGGG
ncbi:hypothetical protein DITRI_Ditri11bG0082000 [Diplodiscus trichospermus]